ncbi:hypothetical protein [Glycomyces sp. NPDC047010]|uniref:hypothetical protein n=1 Tax=Glycomyces sp. NPDC047010 TaxID=3155023 RepID=UPI0033F49936
MMQARELFPLSGNGGVTVSVKHEPGTVRPFAATIASALAPQADKHSRPPTSKTVNTTQKTSMDGQQVDDTANDTQND